MADILSKEQRHKNMQRIRSKDTKPELILRKALWRKGYRYRKNYRNLPGKPDIVLTKQRICIFVDSEFFHGKNYEYGYHSRKYTSLKEQLENSDNSEFWINKIQNNIDRDRRVNEELREMGWTVLRFWSRDVMKQTNECVRKVEEIVISIKPQQ